MKRVKMKVQISGTHDGEKWPAPGSVVELPDDEAAARIASGHAVEVDVEPTEESAAETADAVEAPERAADVPVETAAVEAPEKAARTEKPTRTRRGS